MVPSHFALRIPADTWPDRFVKPLRINILPVKIRCHSSWRRAVWHLDARTVA